MAYILKNQKIEKIALQIVKDLKNAGYKESFFVGGFVRDKLLGIEFEEYFDIDIATEARPDEIKKLFNKERFIEVGEAFNIIIILIKGHKFEIATFREDIFEKDTKKWDGRHPLGVSYASAEDDARRRDFTVNAIFYDPVEKKHIDFVKGIRDIKNKIIRTIGEPEERFREDYLRMLRAIRFAVQKNFKIDIKVLAAIKIYAENITSISKERILIELNKIFSSANPSEGLILLRESNLLKWIYLYENKVRKHININEKDFNYTTTCLTKTPLTLLLNWVIFFQLLHLYIIDMSDLKNILIENKFDNKTIDNIIWILKNKIVINNWDNLSKYEKMKLSIHPQFETLFLFLQIEENTKKETNKYYNYGRIIQNIRFFYDNFRSDEEKWAQMSKFTIIDGNDLLKIGIRGKKIGVILEEVKRKYVIDELNSKNDILEYIMGIMAT